MTTHYDVIIIGSGAGGGTLACRLAPSGRCVLLLDTRRYKLDAGRREAPGEVEHHGHVVDVMHVVEGSPTVVTGGDMLDRGRSPPGELRGRAVQGGTTHQLAEGDVLAIPAGVPHQFVTVSDPFLMPGAVLPNDLHDVNKLRISTGAYWPHLSDGELEVQRTLEIDEYTDSHHQATVPHTLVLAPGLIIDKVYVGYWVWGRPSPYQLWEDLQDLLRRSKVDFDPTTPEARAAWQTSQELAPSPRWPRRVVSPAGRRRRRR